MEMQVRMALPRFTCESLTGNVAFGLYPSFLQSRLRAGRGDGDPLRLLGAACSAAYGGDRGAATRRTIVCALVRIYSVSCVLAILC